MPRAAIIGSGPAAAGWAARFQLMGWDVVVHAGVVPSSAQGSDLLARAGRALSSLSDVVPPRPGRRSLQQDLAATVAGVDWITVCPPPDLPAARDLIATVAALCPLTAIIAIGSADHDVAALQSATASPGQIIGAVGFDPIYLMPSVAMTQSPANPAPVVAGAVATLRSLGMVPVGENASRDTALVETQQALCMVADCVPDGDARDRLLVTLLRGFKTRNHGVGSVLNALDLARDTVPRTLASVVDLSRPVTTFARAVPLDWTDYNGHMTEARYLHAFGEATDRMMILVGCTPGYVAAGHSFFTAETHIRHLDEVQEGTGIHIDTQVLAGRGKKMHLFHRMWAGDRLLATGEHMLIHVSLTTRSACAPSDAVAIPLARIAAAHAGLPMPDGAGRAVGRK
ncbi:thioesterase family protein [Loktanella sp. DSM 29012]|uniref:thioesterase family protein n=1 Tax=Loktanella sp. DSM 29012 TaxID=1881056 RepID=UPI000B7FF6D8|nr:thioesterase family protein [Loktanella sp. DSM 29012]